MVENSTLWEMRFNHTPPILRVCRKIVPTPDAVGTAREKEREKGREIQWTPVLVLAALQNGSLTLDDNCLWIPNKQKYAVLALQARGHLWPNIHRGKELILIQRQMVACPYST